MHMPPCLCVFPELMLYCTCAGLPDLHIWQLRCKGHPGLACSELCGCRHHCFSHQLAPQYLEIRYDGKDHNRELVIFQLTLATVHLSRMSLTWWAVEFDIQWGVASLGTVYCESLGNMGSHSCAQTWTWAPHLAGVHRVPHWYTEWTSRDRVTSIINVDIIFSRSERNILHTAAAIFIVLAGYFCLWGSFDGQTEAPCTSTSEREAQHFRSLRMFEISSWELHP